MVHLDLFSGIGGFALAVDEVFSGTEHIFCEIDPYCQALLKRRFPGATIFGDIRELAANSTNTGVKNLREWKDKVFLVTAGVPCQPASQAGKRRGTKDDRWLWPEAFRVIRETQPRFVILENVRGILSLESGLVFKSLLAEMENSGYETRAYIIPAVAVNAPHRRYRVWFVANRNHPGERTSSGRIDQDRQEKSEERKQPCPEFSGYDGDASDTCGERFSGVIGGEFGSVCATLEALPRREYGRTFAKGMWGWNWLEVATELCGVDDGLPAELDGLKLSKARHRVERLKALGNAIVPQVAIEILRGINHALINQKGE